MELLNADKHGEYSSFSLDGRIGTTLLGNNSLEGSSEWKHISAIMKEMSQKREGGDGETGQSTVVFWSDEELLKPTFGYFLGSSS